MTPSKIFCFIPAKATSSRLPNKNMLLLEGKEMFLYPLHEAQKTKLFGNHIIVSTDSSTIADITRKNGGIAVHRSPALSHDPAGVSDVLLNFLYEHPTYQHFDTVMIMLPTAPLLLAEDIIGAFKTYRTVEANFLMSVSETDHSAWRAIELHNQKISPLFPQKIRKKSQELTPTYFINGAIVICNVQSFMEKKTYFGNSIASYIMPKDRSIDIDTLHDFHLASLMLQNRKQNQNDLFPTP